MEVDSERIGNERLNVMLVGTYYDEFIGTSFNIEQVGLRILSGNGGGCKRKEILCE